MNIKIVIKIILFGLIIPGMLGVSILTVKAYRSPLGDELQMNSPTMTPVTNQVVSTAIPINSQETVCGESAVWNVLVLGSDAGEMRGNKGTDLIRMMRVDFPNRRVTIFAFPPNLWVDTNGLGLTDPTIQATNLSMVFYEARSRSNRRNLKDAIFDGTTASARMLLNNFSISTDHYLTVDLSQVPVMVDAVDGIPVNIPQPITDPWIGMVIPAGQQTLNGTQFVAYARAIPDSDFDRIQRNNLLIDALQEKLVDPKVWGQIPQLYAKFNGVIATDFSPEQINQLVCLLKEVPANAIIKEGIKPEWTRTGPVAGSLLWDKVKVIDHLRGLGLIP